ncbi:unnamed protein product [Camellia sinensis]
MGRGRVELKRIENKINRQVTFAKRRNGLLKKAYELSVLCDAEVALIIFSNRGKLYEFCSTSNMPKTLERYQKCSYHTPEVNHLAKEIEQSSYREYSKLKDKYEALQCYQRQLLGEDLGPLNIKELEHLEHQLETTLRQIRSTKLKGKVLEECCKEKEEDVEVAGVKVHNSNTGMVVNTVVEETKWDEGFNRTQSMLDQLYDLQTKEKLWLESNRALETKLDEIYREHHIRSSWAGSEQCSIFSQQQQQHPQSQVFFQPLECNSNLQIGYNPEVSNQINAAANHDDPNMNSFIPGWML